MKALKKQAKIKSKRNTINLHSLQQLFSIKIITKDSTTSAATTIQFNSIQLVSFTYRSIVKRGENTSTKLFRNKLSSEKHSCNWIVTRKNHSTNKLQVSFSPTNELNNDHSNDHYYLMIIKMIIISHYWPLQTDRGFHNMFHATDQQTTFLFVSFCFKEVWKGKRWG